MPLEEVPAEQRAAVPEESSEDTKLRELISEIEGSVKQTLSADEKSVRKNDQGVLFAPGNQGEEQISVTPEHGTAPVFPSAAASISDYEQTKAAMEQALASIEQHQVSAEKPQRRSAAKNAAAVLLVIGVVAAGIVAGYFLSVKEPQTRAPIVPAQKTPPQVPAAATPPAMARPVIPQQPEKPVPEESKPPAPPAVQPAEPVKEPPAVAVAQPAQPEPKTPAPVPVKEAPEQPTAVSSIPVSASSAAEQKAPGLPPESPASLQPSGAAASAYCVNAGSFKLKESTEGVCRDLKKYGYEPTVEIVTLRDGNTWYRVTVGSFATRAEAAQFGRELESKTSIKPLVVKKK
jgi:cell division protein FtsN